MVINASASVFPPAMGSVATSSLSVLPAKLREVLVVDDEFVIRTVLEKILRREGMTVFSASSGTEALRILHERGRRIGLLMTDIRMTGMSGAGLVTAIRNGEAPDFRGQVMVMSGGFTFEDEQALDQLHISPENRIDKPFTAISLVERVAGVFRE